MSKVLAIYCFTLFMIFVMSAFFHVYTLIAGTGFVNASDLPSDDEDEVGLVIGV